MKNIAYANFGGRAGKQGVLLQMGKWRIGHLKVERGTGSVSCPVALWDCFGNAVTSLFG